MRTYLHASRTSPTEMAVGLAEQLNVTVCGYVRGESLNVYAGHGILVDGSASGGTAELPQAPASRDER